MPEKKAKTTPVPTIKKPEVAAVPSRTAADSLALMFRRGINGSHNKGKSKLVSTKERITRDEFLSVGGDFVTIFDHKMRKELEPFVQTVITEANPKLDRFYCTEEMLRPSYVPTPFVPKTKAKTPVENAPAKETPIKKTIRKPKAAKTAPAPEPATTPSKKGKKTAAVEKPVPASVVEKKKRSEKQPKK